MAGHFSLCCGKHVTPSNGEPAEDKQDKNQEEKVQSKHNITVLNDICLTVGHMRLRHIISPTEVLRLFLNVWAITAFFYCLGLHPVVKDKLCIHLGSILWIYCLHLTLVIFTHWANIIDRPLRQSYLWNLSSHQFGQIVRPHIRKENGSWLPAYVSILLFPSDLENLTLIRETS